MTKRVLVTGAAGFIGSRLVEILLSKGYQVVGIDNFRTGKRKNLEEALQNDRFRLYELDISQAVPTTDINGPIDVVFHLAAISSVKESIESPILVDSTNVVGTINVLELARRLDVRRIVFSSSAAVYGDPERIPITEDTPVSPLSPYAASKIAAEMYIQTYSKLYGIEGTILRYFNVFGPRQAYSEYSGVISIFINEALNNSPIKIEGSGEQTRSFIYVDDVAKASILAAEREGARDMVMNISGTKAVSISSLAQQVKELVRGTRSDILNISPRPGDVTHSIGNIERAQRILGFTPEMTLEDGLNHTIDWYRSHHT
ncbi:MAG: NAD-dependent epimerase/dehydratase family protein [Candidatus Thorarchaeota archaeon]|nr:NAD-dependent epimerase/dehydratase family protein [Candidatus Thorarchaeota archaeon]